MRVDASDTSIVVIRAGVSRPQATSGYPLRRLVGVDTVLDGGFSRRTPRPPCSRHPATAPSADLACHCVVRCPGMPLPVPPGERPAAHPRVLSQGPVPHYPARSVVHLHASSCAHPPLSC